MIELKKLKNNFCYIDLFIDVIFEIFSYLEPKYHAKIFSGSKLPNQQYKFLYYFKHNSNVKYMLGKFENYREKVFYSDTINLQKCNPFVLDIEKTKFYLVENNEFFPKSIRKLRIYFEKSFILFDKIQYVNAPKKFVNCEIVHQSMFFFSHEFEVEGVKKFKIEINNKIYLFVRPNNFISDYCLCYNYPKGIYLTTSEFVLVNKSKLKNIKFRISKKCTNLEIDNVMDFKPNLSTLKLKILKLSKLRIDKSVDKSVDESVDKFFKRNKYPNYVETLNISFSKIKITKELFIFFKRVKYLIIIKCSIKNIKMLIENCFETNRCKTRSIKIFSKKNLSLCKKLKYYLKYKSHNFFVFYNKKIFF